MSFSEISSSHKDDGWTFLDKGADSVVQLDPTRHFVRKTYRGVPLEALSHYRDTALLASQELYWNPFERRIDGVRFSLKDIVPISAIGYDTATGDWSAVSAYVAGPHLSAAAYNLDLYRKQVAELDGEEMEAVDEIQRILHAHPLNTLHTGINRMLNDVSVYLGRTLHIHGIDIISLNAKLRRYGGEDFYRLVVTDISPSLRSFSTF